MHSKKNIGNGSAAFLQCKLFTNDSIVPALRLVERLALVSSPGEGRALQISWAANRYTSPGGTGALSLPRKLDVPPRQSEWCAQQSFPLRVHALINRTDNNANSFRNQHVPRYLAGARPRLSTALALPKLVLLPQ